MAKFMTDNPACQSLNPVSASPHQTVIKSAITEPVTTSCAGDFSPIQLQRNLSILLHRLFLDHDIIVPRIHPASPHEIPTHSQS